MTVLKPHPENADRMPGGLISLVRDSKLWLKAPVFQEMKVYAVSRGLMMCRRVSKMKWDFLRSRETVTWMPSLLK